MTMLSVCGLLGGWYVQRDPYLPCINNPYKPQMQIKKASNFIQCEQWIFFAGVWLLSTSPTYVLACILLHIAQPCNHTTPQSPPYRLRVSCKVFPCSVILVQTISVELYYTNFGVRGHHLQRPCNTGPQLPSLASQHGFARYLRAAEKVRHRFLFNFMLFWVFF